MFCQGERSRFGGGFLLGRPVEKSLDYRGIAMPHRFPLLTTIALLCGSASYGHADVIISSAATSNMSCSNGVCAPTATKAVLNVNDLESLLASGNVEVTTTGSGGVQADDIDVDAPFSWSNGNSLTLDAYESATIDRPVAVDGQSSVSIITNDGGSGGTLSFGTKGSVAFQNLSSQLAINGTGYTLVNTVATLASAIAANPGGSFAFAGKYNASRDGTYSQSPVSTSFEGTLEGLGNAILKLKVAAPGGEGEGSVGLFSLIQASGTVRDVRLVRVDIAGPAGVGGLAGGNDGTAIGDFVSGRIKGGEEDAVAGGLFSISVGNVVNCSSTATVTAPKLGGVAGGLIGGVGGTVSNSFATGSVTAGKGDRYRNEQVGIGGGLVGYDGGTISGSFATGSVSGGHNSLVGGLVGATENGENAAIENSYSTGSIVGGQNSDAGGLVGLNIFFVGEGTITASYSAGAASGGTGSFIGGLLGYDDNSGGCDCLSDTYWDTTTSGITNLGQGAGNIANDPGITGLSTKQFRSGLPAGFDSTVWAEDRKINNGLPYLIANPPRK
jgi:hypothetical protein